MIYTIKCRRGHCGAKFDHDSTVDDPLHNAQILRNRAMSQGWYADDQAGGWLCPFDAPKEAAKPADPTSEIATYCLDPGCCNANTASVPAILKANGWHESVNGFWHCPACWKTTQPEPTPVQPEAFYCALPNCPAFFSGHQGMPVGWNRVVLNDEIGHERYICPSCVSAGIVQINGGIDYASAQPAPGQCDWSIEQVKEVAVEVFAEYMSGLLADAMMFERAGNQKDALADLSLALRAFSERKSNGDPGRDSSGPTESSEPSPAPPQRESLDNGNAPLGGAPGSKANPYDTEIPF